MKRMAQTDPQRAPVGAPAEPAQWFVRRGNQVRGPYRWSTIEMNLAMGRIRANDEVCQAGPRWQSLDALRGAAVAPAAASETLRRRLETPLAARRARAARVWASLHEERPARPRRGILTALGMMLAIMAVFCARFATPVTAPAVDCKAAPARGVNWDFCALPGLFADGADLRRVSARNARLYGARLVDVALDDADLAYADLGAAHLAMSRLRGARLVGSSLRDADLNRADLRDSDLRFADLSGASLRGAMLDGARLDNAIWPDGRICAGGSIGTCLSR